MALVGLFLLGCSSKNKVLCPKPFSGFIKYKELPKVSLKLKRGDLNSYEIATKELLILTRKLRLQNEAYRKQIDAYNDYLVNQKD